MKNPGRMALLAPGLALLAVCTAFAGFDIFVQVDGIPGESADASHIDWIEASSVSHLIQPGAHGHYSVTKWTDRATPLLHLRASDGQSIPTVVIDMADPVSGNSIYTVTLRDVTVASIHSAGHTTNATATLNETVDFSYGEIEWVYDGPSPGTENACWNVTNNAVCP